MRGRTVRIWLTGSAVILFLYLSWEAVRLADYEKIIMESLYLECEAGGQTAELSLWRDETDGAYYLFLPSWFSGKSSKIIWHYFDKAGKIRINGTPCHSGESWVEPGREQVYSLEIYNFWGKEVQSSSLQVLASEHLPSMFVAVEDEKDLISDRLFDNKKYLESGYAVIRDETGDVLLSQELSRFKVRGNLTATLDKKPFTFSFRKPVSILGMEPGIKWNLLANATDGAYIRNKIIRDLAYESIDAYEPQGEFIELYLNGEYQGLYLLTEPVEIEENRLEISAKDDWFLEMELDFRAKEDPTRIVTDRGQIFIVHSDAGVTEEEKAYLTNRLNDIESALYDEKGISAVSGKSLDELIDLESFVEAWLVEELSGDHDVGLSSQFMYAGKEADSLWYSGPVWDFDGIMGNVNTPMYSVPEALTGVVAMARPEGNQNQNRWLSAMYRYPAFQALVREKYQKIFRQNYEEILTRKIDEYIAKIERSACLDALRWHEKRLEWWFRIPERLDIPDTDGYKRYDTLRVSVDVVKDFMSRKMAFLDKLWIDKREFCVVEIRNPVSFLNQEYNQTLYYWVEKGTAIQDLPCYEAAGWRFEGYYDKDTGESVSDGSVIEKDRILEGVWSEKGAE